MLVNFLRILANFLRSLRLLNNQFAEFLVNPLRMLRILTNAFENFANACERLTNETNTQRMRCETPCQCFAVSLLFASLSWIVKIVLFILFILTVLQSQSGFQTVQLLNWTFTYLFWNFYLQKINNDCYLFVIELLLVCFIIELLKYIFPKSNTN